MDKQQKRLMRKIRRRRNRKYGGFRDDEELLHESNTPEQDSPSSEMIRLQGLIGNQAVQRLITNTGSSDDSAQREDNAKKDDNVSDSDKADSVIELFKSSAHYKDLKKNFDPEQISQALNFLKDDAAQFIKLSEYKAMAFPLLKRSVSQYLENEAKVQAEEKKAPERAANPYPFLPVVRKSVNRVLAADSPPPQKESAVKKLDEEKGEATQDKTQEEQEGGDFTDGKNPAKDIEDRTIIAAANTRITLEGLLQGIYKQMPEETIKEFQEVHDTIRTSSGYIAHKTREKAQEAFENIKIVIDATKDADKEPVLDPLQGALGETEGMKDNVLKAAITARTAITDIITSKPDVAEQALDEKADEQEKEVQAAAADGDEDTVVLPDVGAIKAQGFVMSYNQMLDRFITKGKAVRSSDAASGVYAEQRVAQDLINTPSGKTVVILSAHEPIQERRQAIIDLAFKRQDLKVFVCFVNGANVATGNRMIDASHGGWRNIIHFR